MKKILVILALMFSSVFGDCLYNASMYFKYIGADMIHSLYLNIAAGYEYSKEEIRGYTSKNGIIESIEFHLNEAKKKGHHNAYNFLNNLFINNQDKVVDLVNDGLQEVNNNYKVVLDNKIINKNNWTYTLTEVFRLNKNRILESIIKMHNCHYN